MGIKEYIKFWMDRYREENNSHPVAVFLKKYEEEATIPRETWEEARKSRGWLSYQEYCEQKRKERE